jgi:hypothetical protein
MSTQEQITKLETLFDMTSHTGWGLLIEDLEERVNAIKEGMLNGELSTYDVGLAQAHVKVFREFINLRKMIDMALRQQQEDADEAVAI